MNIRNLICLAGLIFPIVTHAENPPTTLRADVLFSPGGGCTDRIIQEISKATRKVRVQAYSFTSAPIAKAILEAKKRGVDCEVILDKSQETQNYSELDFFFNQGIPTYIDDRHAIAHNKIILIDDATVITGSFNFSKAAEESNAENVLVLTGDTELASKYAANYADHREHSRKYASRSVASGQPRAPPTAPVIEQPTTGTSNANSIETVYVTRTGSKYHRAGCSYLKSSIPLSLEQAKVRYGPCSRCKPPT